MSIETNGFKALSESFNVLITKWEVPSFFAFMGALSNYVFGLENHEMLFILLLLIFGDVIVGMVKALKQSNFNARGMSKLLYKAPVYAVFLATSHLTEVLIDGHFGFSPHVIDSLAYFYLFTRETKSIVEKMAFFGINYPVPFVLIEKKFNQLQLAIEQIEHHEKKSSVE